MRGKVEVMLHLPSSSSCITWDPQSGIPWRGSPRDTASAQYLFVERKNKRLNRWQWTEVIITTPAPSYAEDLVTMGARTWKSPWNWKTEMWWNLRDHNPSSSFHRWGDMAQREEMIALKTQGRLAVASGLEPGALTTCLGLLPWKAASSLNHSLRFLCFQRVLRF